MTTIESAPAPAVEQSAGTLVLIAEQQLLFSSAAALAPAKTHRWTNPAHEIAVVARALFTRPEQRRPPKHYPQQFAYLENSAMSRAMDRL